MVPWLADLISTKVWTTKKEVDVLLCYTTGTKLHSRVTNCRRTFVVQFLMAGRDDW